MLESTAACGLEAIGAEVVGCRRCPRLVGWREEVAVRPPPRYRGQAYWARPVPGFGDHQASILVAGLAPAANGGNRTGRVFTGDRSGEWLFAALWRAGLASQAASIAAGDALRLQHVYISALVKCAPPANRPRPDERDSCAPYLGREIAALTKLRVIVALGAFAWDGILRILGRSGATLPSPRPRFGHASHLLVGDLHLLGCFHPSQQNTFTGRLTATMMDCVLQTAKRLAGIGGVE